MPVFKILLYALLIYLGYRLVFGFIIPVYRATRQVKKSFREMKEKMNEHMKEQQEQFQANEKPSKPKERPGDYIEFEEIK